MIITVHWFAGPCFQENTSDRRKTSKLSFRIPYHDASCRYKFQLWPVEEYWALVLIIPFGTMLGICFYSNVFQWNGTWYLKTSSHYNTKARIPKLKAVILDQNYAYIYIYVEFACWSHEKTCTSYWVHIFLHLVLDKLHECVIILIGIPLWFPLSGTNDQPETVDYKKKYKALKRKLRFLVYVSLLRICLYLIVCMTEHSKLWLLVEVRCEN